MPPRTTDLLAILLAAAAPAALAGVGVGAGPQIRDEVGSCPAGSGGDAAACVSAREYRAGLERDGLQIRLRKRTIEEKTQVTVVSDDVFYGRAVIKVPRRALLSLETTPDADVRRELSAFLIEESQLEKRYNVTGEDAPHLLSLAYPLILINRDPGSVFREWLDAVNDERLTVLGLTERQRRVLRGTTVEEAYDEMARNRDLIEQSAANFTPFRAEPVTRVEADWAIAVIMRHARVVHPHQDVREARAPRMYLFPFVELLDVQLHPEPGVAMTFQEEILFEGKKEQEMVVQIARRDIPKGEEVFFWPGRLSNSEMIARHGMSFPRNPVGIGRNITQPPNWSPDKRSNIFKEYDKYDCSGLDAFELRFSPLGTPMRNFVRCYRLSWFLTNGWYSPALLKRRRELEKWPPPKKYSKEDWLSWTQADAALIGIIREYCQDMRERLKDTMDSEIAEDFRQSLDPVDRLLWQLRGEESRTFRMCLEAAKAITV